MTIIWGRGGNSSMELVIYDEIQKTNDGNVIMAL